MLVKGRAHILQENFPAFRLLSVKGLVLAFQEGAPLIKAEKHTLEILQSGSLFIIPFLAPWEWLGSHFPGYDMKPICCLPSLHRRHDLSSKPKIQQAIFDKASNNIIR